MIRFLSLTKRFGALSAVTDLSLEVHPSEAYALLGPNGAGKTTALRCLAALLRPTAGGAEVCGVGVAGAPLEARRRMAFLSTSMGLYERLSARELVEYFARLHGLDQRGAAERTARMIELFGLGGFADRLCGRLSTGQRQRVSLARALVHDPPVLVLDEPTAGLDVLSGSAIHDLVRSERERGKTILFSTHQMEEVELLADRVGVLAGGRLVAEGTPADLVARTGAPSLAHAFLALVGEAAPGGEAARGAEAGA
ncbi:MAG TPA: ABC transporter ATP-binding protein [Longimicrobiales bacterium]|nr:ABC transporter ATP-binding protein [Longimicrobiales bacterium]